MERIDAKFVACNIHGNGKRECQFTYGGDTHDLDSIEVIGGNHSSPGTLPSPTEVNDFVVSDYANGISKCVKFDKDEGTMNGNGVVCFAGGERQVWDGYVEPEELEEVKQL